MKVLLRSSLVSDTEYGEDTLEIVNTLIKMGIDVYLYPTAVKPPISSSLAALLTKKYPESFDLALHYVLPSESEIPKDLRISSTVNALWICNPQTMFNKRLIQGLRGYDVILAQDENTYGSLADNVEIPVLIVSPGFNSGSWKPLNRTWDGPFVFIMVLTDSGNQYPEIAIESFHELKKDFGEFDDSALIIKTIVDDNLNYQLEHHIPGLQIVKANWTKENFHSFFRMGHVLIASDKGGQRNKAALEFMSTGGTVIATDWSLNTSWLSRSYAYPLAFNWETAHKDSRNKSVIPQKYALKEIMLEAVQNRNATKQKGQFASEVIPPMMDWSKVLNSMFESLKDVDPVRGSRLFEKYKRCVPVQEEEKPWMM